MKIRVIHGPNLNLLGTREPSVYGTMSLADVNEKIDAHAKKNGIIVEFFQSNHEGELIEAIHNGDGIDGYVINPAGYGHTSVALLDAVKGAGIPSVEAHMSNIHSRESFRSHTMTSSAMVGVITGFGFMSYILALDAIVHYLSTYKK
jgi:3-dehydroquinate dehydratase-2